MPDHQLSLAIGKEGQNARLSAKLTGWRIDIKSETQALETNFLMEDEEDFDEEMETAEAVDEMEETAEAVEETAGTDAEDTDAEGEDFEETDEPIED